MVKRLNVERARALRVAQTDAERALWRRLRNRALLDWKFRRQHEIGPYIVDFVCTDAGLIVELDGGQHLEQVEEDAARTRWLQRSGYCVLRFWNDDVLKNIDVVLEQILKALAAERRGSGEPDVALRTSPHPGPLPGGERGRSA
ncbi:endonuclease domain-containing protein [Dokdonella fugitiva]|uniref:Very-short-patch-repair endonuclease n=1 Tax=Dokdonella fugitiva TaxID=328517 RepID=A0A4R2I401_9GAMM|nr:very-short-patch-repair endonuclease [Dokdonella fugitiva]